MHAHQRLTSPDGLSWIKQQVSQDPRMTRQRLAREVCAHFGWRDALGRPKEMACRKYLLQLQRRGLIQLPPPRYIAQPRRCQQCAVPEDVAHFSGTLAHLGGVELQAVTGRTPESRRWNALMDAHHPQGSGPLCGAQLRYLVISVRVGEIGGLAISAPAWRLAARDQWLGWSDAQRAENLSGIVSNSRFLILPSIFVKHLASHVLGLLTRRIAADWQQRYGVSPWLLETCVELERTGTAYRAANWIEVGLTAGRGRQDRHHTSDLLQKRVFLLPLCKTTLEHLCGKRAAPEPGWVHQEFAGAKLGDRRLQTRLFDLAEAFFAHPTATIQQALSVTGAQAAYRFLAHEETTLEALLAPHRLATLARMRRERVVLLVQDTLSFSPRRARIGGEGTGVRLRTTLAFSAQGLPLGILATSPLGNEDAHDEGWALICEAQHRCPQTRIVSVADCEGDIGALFDKALQQKGDCLVRAKGNEVHLQPYLQSPIPTVDAAFPVALREARRDLSVRFSALATNRPLWAIWAKERKAPEGAAPIDWLLVTSVAVDSVGDALKRIAWYACRSGIEVFRTILDSSCHVRRLVTAERLEACLAIDLVVAWRLHYLASSGRAPAERSDAKTTLPAAKAAHRRAADPEPLHRAHGA
jgi:hypothetical protein